jgi:hypothetical protein
VSRPPVSLLDFLDLFFAQPEVVADFMDQRFADHGANLVLVFAVLFNRLLEERDLIGRVLPQGQVRSVRGVPW